MADIIHKIFGKQHGHHSSKHGESSKKEDKEKESGAEGYTKQQMEFCKYLCISCL